LLFAIPNVFKFTIIMTLFFFIFAEILVSYFKGKLFYCDALKAEYMPFVNDKWDCMTFGGDWLNKTYNFDNILNALVTLFVMSTTNGWSEIMNSALVSKDIDI
jgi:Ion transport protein